jgi:hypothetical protein
LVYNESARINTGFISRRASPMFESLDEHMKHDDRLETTTKERIMRWVAIAVVSVLVFAGLFFSVRMLE